MVIGATNSLVNDLYCCTLFLKMGGHFMQIAAHVRRVVEENVRLPPLGFGREAEEREAAAFAEEFADYLKSTFTFDANDRKDVERPDFFETKVSEHARQVDRMLAVFNGPIWKRGVGFVHYCRGCHRNRQDRCARCLPYKQCPPFLDSCLATVFGTMPGRLK